jgi:surface antigen
MRKNNPYLVTLLALLLALPLLAQAGPWKAKHGKPDKWSRSEAAEAGGPPPWAPAHGYRRHRGGPPDRDPEVYVSYTRKLGIGAGTCNREEVGALLGGIIGGVIGSKVGEHNDAKAAGTIAGTVIGVLVGRNIGREMDQADQQCTGQVLERARDGETIIWHNDEAGVEFRVTPMRTFQRDGLYCRAYVTVADGAGGSRRVEGEACRNGDGTWQLAGGGAHL